MVNICVYFLMLMQDHRPKYEVMLLLLSSEKTPKQVDKYR